MAPRNWWIEARMGDSNVLHAFGPRRKDAGFALRIYQRVRGESRLALHLEGYVLPDGRLRLLGAPEDDVPCEMDTILRIITPR